MLKVIPDFDIEKYALGDIDYFKHIDERLDDNKIIKIQRNKNEKRLQRQREGFSRENCGRKIDKREIRRL